MRGILGRPVRGFGYRGHEKCVPAREPVWNAPEAPSVDPHEPECSMTNDSGARPSGVLRRATFAFSFPSPT
jgi:hypothetical protein